MLFLLFNTGTGASSDKTSATAEPNPPITLCSSTVTIAPVSLAALIKISLSIGFNVCILITLALIPSFYSASLASNATSTIIPVATIVISLPSAKVTPLPILNSYVLSSFIVFTAALPNLT